MENTEPYFMINKGSFIQFRNQNILKYYDIEEKELGRGAYGVVFRARQKGSTENNNYRAIKAISKKMIKNMSSLMNEIENLAILDHPGIIKLYETFQDKKNVFLVTEQFDRQISLCEGGQLFEKLVRKGSFLQIEARDIFLQIIQVIKYCNSKKIAHRDLKPQNFIFLNSTSLNIKMIDFGLSFQWIQSMREELKMKNQNKLIGTPYYIAPEIIEGSYDEKCDIWSAGIILYTLVTGTLPFKGQSMKETLNLIKKGNVKFSISEFNNITPQCKDLLMKLLQPENKRIQLDQIFIHPWVKLKVPRNCLKINFQAMEQFVKFSKLKKITLAYIAFRLSERQVENLLNLFRQIDINYDGYISVEELYQTLSRQKSNKSFLQLSEIINMINTKKTNKINYTQFVASNLQESHMLNKENLLKVFQMIDIDGNGRVDKKQLQTVLVKNKMINLSINGVQIDLIMKQCDKNQDGNIDFEQFVSHISNQGYSK